jgi:hypothetical protein
METKPKMTVEDLPNASPSPTKSPRQQLQTTGTASFWAAWADEMNIKDAQKRSRRSSGNSKSITAVAGRSTLWWRRGLNRNQLEGLAVQHIVL